MNFRTRLRLLSSRTRLRLLSGAEISVALPGVERSRNACIYMRTSALSITKFTFLLQLNTSILSTVKAIF
ncbi:MAG TPA: hypothetical protein PK495_07555 [Bacteroidales bacterium]|nr:hypothetical protein [Bacteroidales bacterium]